MRKRLRIQGGFHQVGLCLEVGTYSNGSTIRIRIALRGIDLLKKIRKHDSKGLGNNNESNLVLEEYESLVVLVLRKYKSKWEYIGSTSIT